MITLTPQIELMSNSYLISRAKLGVTAEAQPTRVAYPQTEEQQAVMLDLMLQCDATLRPTADELVIVVKSGGMVPAKLLERALKSVRAAENAREVVAKSDEKLDAALSEKDAAISARDGALTALAEAKIVAAENAALAIAKDAVAAENAALAIAKDAELAEALAQIQRLTAASSAAAVGAPVPPASDPPLPPVPPPSAASAAAPAAPAAPLTPVTPTPVPPTSRRDSASSIERLLGLAHGRRSTSEEHRQ